MTSIEGGGVRDRGLGADVVETPAPGAKPQQVSGPLAARAQLPLLARNRKY